MGEYRFGERLKKIRITRGFNDVKAFCQRLGLKESALITLESKKDVNPTLKTLTRLADALNMETAELVYEMTAKKFDESPWFKISESEMYNYIKTVYKNTEKSIFILDDVNPLIWLSEQGNDLFF